MNNEQTARQFLEVHVMLNKDVPGWIRPLDKDIEQVFNPGKNKAYRHGECIRWILKDEQGRLAGRIAAFVNKKYTTKGDTCPVGGIGFFDCINDQAAATLLFDSARQWLQERGMGAMDGPINFGERNNWWGLLTEGFHEPLYCMNFNPPYYTSLFETYGFQVFFKQICFSLKVKDRLQKRFYSRHEALAADPLYTARHIDKNNLQKFANEFTFIYNKAWAQHAGGKDMAPGQAMAIFKQMKPVIDERLVWFMYYNNEPIGCWLSLPELNQYFKQLNGKFGLLQKLKFLWLKTFRPTNKFTGILFGVIPEFQGKGADAYLIMEAAKVIQHKSPYDLFEMQWIGDFNPKMLNVAENLGGDRSRSLTTYRYLFDRTAEFQRHPFL